MNKLQQLGLILALSTAYSCVAVSAQGSHDSEQTHPWQDYNYQPSPGNSMAPPGQSYRTDTQGVTDYNAPYLPETETPVLAPQSVDGAAIPSGKYDFGFKGGKDEPYKGPYREGGGGSSIGGGGKTGGMLPKVGTSSVDIDLGK